MARHEMIDLEMRKYEKRIAKTNAEKESFQALSQTKMAELEQQKKELEDELKQRKENQEQSSKEWEANVRMKLNNVQEEFLKEINNRKKQEEAQISNLKIINEEAEQKAIKLANSLKELKTVVKAKTDEMAQSKRQEENSNIKEGDINSATVTQQPIKVVENQMIGTTDVDIDKSSDFATIAVIGLPKTGRSTLVGALAGGIWPKNLFQNPIVTNLGTIYKLNYPNNGFVNGSVNENRAIYEEFFESSNLSNLSTLIITIDGPVREEDYLVLSLAQQYRIPTVIARTKLDEWLDNRPKQQSKEDYVADDKKYVIESLQKLGITISENNIFNVTALAIIIIKEDGPKSDMLKYLQDEQLLLNILHFENDNNTERMNERSHSEIVILGLKGSGKSTIIDGLVDLKTIEKNQIQKLTYDETMPLTDIVKETENLKAKLYLIVVPNTVGNIDAHLVERFVKSGKNFAVLLNRSDEITGNLKKQQTFVCMEDYVHDRHEAANIEFQKLQLDCSNIPLFAISGYKLREFVDDTAEEESFLNFLKQVI